MTPTRRCRKTPWPRGNQTRVSETVLRRMRASVFGVLMSLEPAMAALSGLLFLGQHLQPREWAAVVCVMAASIGATRRAGRDEQPVEPGATPTQVLVP